MGRLRWIAAILVTMAMATTPVPGDVQTWPLKPIKFVVAFPPGGGNDILARVVSEKLAQSLGQSIIIDNRAGGGGNIGAEFAARSAADGYTFLIAGPAILAVNPHLYAKIGYDPIKDFEPVGLLGQLAVVLAVNADVPAHSVAELIALAKANPGSLFYASAGPGTVHHLAAELFKSMAGVSLVHVPYKGGIPAATDLIAGRVHIMFAPVNNLVAYLPTGRLRVLGVGGSTRMRSFPDVPTIAEAGVPGYNVGNWIGIVAPTGTPKEIVSRLNAEIAKTLEQADVREKIGVQLMEAAIATPAEFMEQIRTENARWGKVIKEAGIRPD